MLIARVIFALLSSACFVSFAWAIGRHFARPDERTPKLMRALSLLGLVFTALQLFAIATVDKFGFAGTVAGVTLYFGSLALFWWAVVVTRRQRLSLAFSSDTPKYLLNTGPYRFIRHPFYTAYTLFWLAGIVITHAWWLIISAAITFAFYLQAARMEEAKFSKGELRATYDEYRKQTGMFLPKILIR